MWYILLSSILLVTSSVTGQIQGKYWYKSLAFSRKKLKKTSEKNYYYFLLYNENIRFDFADELKVGGVRFIYAT